MKRSAAIMALLVAFLAAGCATGPETALNSKALRADHVVYFEQSDRVPKDVLLAAHNEKEPLVAAMTGIPPELAGEVLKEVLAIVPELSKNYSQERMFNALLGRRMLFVGYETPEQLEKINNIVESMGGSIEYVTPQTGAGAGIRTMDIPVEHRPAE